MSRLKKSANGLSGYSKEELLRTIIEKTVSEVYEGNLTPRDITNMADAILDEERQYLRELREKIESDMEE